MAEEFSLQENAAQDQRQRYGISKHRYQMKISSQMLPNMQVLQSELHCNEWCEPEGKQNSGGCCSVSPLLTVVSHALGSIMAVEPQQDVPMKNLFLKEQLIGPLEKKKYTAHTLN